MTWFLELAERLQSANAAGAMLLIVLKATLILAIARLLLAALPRASAATRHLIATAALVAVGVMPVLSVIVPAWHLTSAPAAASQPAVSPQSAAPEAAPHTVGVRDTDTMATAISLARVTGVVPAEPLGALQRATNVARATWKGMAVIGVATVALAMLLHLLAGMAGVWFVAQRAEEMTDDRSLLELDEARGRLALSLDVRLLRTARVTVPVLWGVFRPVLLLPADAGEWPVERLRVVLLHELAHLKRMDGISLLLTRTAVSLFWFHPLAWSLERAGRSECERACDDLVLAGGTKPSEYADHLLAIARSMPSFDPFRSVTLAMSRKSQLEGRLLSILQPGVRRRVFSGRGVAIACALAVAVIAPVSAMRIVAEPAKPQEPQPSGSTLTVRPQIDSLENYIVAQLGKIDKRADRWVETPTTGKGWYERAYDYYHADRYPEAAQAFRKAADEGYARAKSLYNAACSFALAGDADHAIPTLADAMAEGWDDVDSIADDSDFDAIRSDPRFARIVGGRSDVATRRLTRNLERYNELRSSTADSRDGDEWFDVGLNLLSLRQLDASIDAFEHSIAAGQKTGTAMYNLACAYALKGDARSGMTWLDKAIENGFSGDEKLLSDPDIALLRQQSGFEALRRKADDLELRGCCSGKGKYSRWSESEEREGWRASIPHHREVAARYPQSGRASFNLAFTALQARDFATAREAWNRTIALGYKAGTSSYNMACTYALQGDRDSAFAWLERAKAANFELEDHLDHDDDLESLHDDPRWATFTAGLEKHEKHMVWKHKKKRG